MGCTLNIRSGNSNINVYIKCGKKNSSFILVFAYSEQDERFFFKPKKEVYYDWIKTTQRKHFGVAKIRKGVMWDPGCLPNIHSSALNLTETSWQLINSTRQPLP